MVEKLNVKRVNRLLSMMYYDMKEMTDEDRDLPIRWNVMHMYTTAQLAKLLAMKRGLDIELVALAGALHDMAVIVSKKKRIMQKKQLLMFVT